MDDCLAPLFHWHCIGYNVIFLGVVQLRSERVHTRFRRALNKMKFFNCGLHKVRYFLELLETVSYGAAAINRAAASLAWMASTRFHFRYHILRYCAESVFNEA